MDDLIYRKDAIGVLSAQCYRGTDFEDVCGKDCECAEYMAMRDLPSAQKKGRWIPCSERLPDQNGKYLVVGRQKAINILKFDGGRWYGKWGVVAWMPLPSPYREEVSD